MTDHYVVIALETSIIRIGYTVQYQMLKILLEYVSPPDFIVCFSKVLASGTLYNVLSSVAYLVLKPCTCTQFLNHVHITPWYLVMDNR